MTLASAIFFLALFVACLLVQHKSEKRSKRASRQVTKVSEEIVRKLRSSNESAPISHPPLEAAGSVPPEAR